MITDSFPEGCTIQLHLQDRESNELYDFPRQPRVMDSDPFGSEPQPELEAVLAALDDPECRAILKQLDTPMSATELSDACDIPLSTTYRKLDLLSDASLVDELTEIRSDGHHTTRYRVAFDIVEIALEHQSFSVEINRPAISADEQLAQLWSEVRKET